MGLVSLVLGIIGIVVIAQTQIDQQLYILAVGIALFGVLLILTNQLQKRGKTENGFYQIIQDLFAMPDTMKQLAVVQFFSWFALFSLWIYATSAVTRHDAAPNRIVNRMSVTAATGPPTKVATPPPAH